MHASAGGARLLNPLPVERRVAARPWPSVIQPLREIDFNKRKKVKGNESERTFICFHLFFGIRTFQCVRGDSNRKFLFPPNSRLRLWDWPPSRAPQLHFAATEPVSGGLSSTAIKRLSQISVLE